jgi:plasmid maintenance system antidote protein VapI
MELQKYLDRYGSTSKFIAKAINVSPSLISHFLKGRRNLGQYNKEKLMKFLASN